ncbi:MAG: hypothetical protein WCG52_11720, partial [bacterium]
MKQWTIGKKLRLGFGIISLFLLLLAGIAWRELGETKKRMDTIAAQAGKVAKLAEVNDSLDEIQLKMWGLVTSANA